MSKAIQNVFTSKDAYGLYAAAHMHAEARKTGQGITVSFCEGDASSDVMRLIKTIGLAQSMDIELPEKRTIVIANVSLMEYVLIKVGSLMLKDDSIHFIPFFQDHGAMDSIDVDEIEYMIDLIGFDEYVHLLAETMYRRWEAQCDAKIEGKCV